VPSILRKIPVPPGGRTGLAFTTLYGAYAAKTYQLTGQEERSIPLMESEISRLRRLGLYDELSLNYLIYAEFS